MGGGGGGALWKLKTAAKKIFVQICGAFCQRQQNHGVDKSAATPVSRDSPNYSAPPDEKISSEIAGQGTSCNKNLCAICLDPLNYSSGSSAGEAIFTAQCSHAFHFACISSNVRHGSVTCPICRAHWTQLPRNPNNRCSLHNKTDPVMHILDDSIANLGIHTRSFLRSARHDDVDDPIEPDHTSGQPRLNLSLQPFPVSSHSIEESPVHTSLKHVQTALETPFRCSPNNRAYLHVKLANRPATDLVLVASPTGPHLRLMKQAMAMVVFSLRPVDRLAIVTYSSAAARVFPLRRMTSYGKRTALQVIDRLFYMGQADPTDGLKKGVKILGDCVHKNLQSCILHLTDSPSRSYHWFDLGVPVTIHRFHMEFGFGASDGYIMRQFKEFLARTLGGGVRDIKLRIGEGTMVVRIAELRDGEERNIPLCLGEQGRVCVHFSYREGEDGECFRTGEIVAGMEEDIRDTSNIRNAVQTGEKMISSVNWDYHDPSMARRWAKRLHSYRS